MHPPVSWAVVGVQANTVCCCFLQDWGALHPISKQPSKEQQPLTRGSCPVPCREGNGARGSDQPLEGQIGLEQLELWHSLIVNAWKING